MELNYVLNEHIESLIDLAKRQKVNTTLDQRRARSVYHQRQLV